MHDTTQSGGIDPDDVWHFWRGSPELLAQIGRAAVRAVGTDGDPFPRCTIDVEVRGDHEVFAPAEFAKGVTPEALRRFTSILISVEGVAQRPSVAIRRGTLRDRLSIHHGDEIVLMMDGTEQQSGQRTLDVIRAAIMRGTKVMSAQTLVMVAVVVGTVLTGAGMVSAALYLTKAIERPWDLMTAPSGVATGFLVLAVFIAALVLAAWAYPAVEVAPMGQSRIWRIAKIVGAVAIPLILGGITKLLFEP
jgi:hypothetical protein